MTTPNVQFIRERLIPALESGEYQQGYGQLRDENDCFCCLGVACDLLSKDGGITWSKHRYDDGIFDWKAVDQYGNDYVGGLPHGAQSTIGLNARGGRSDLASGFTVGGRGYADLASANDDHRTFHEIAQSLRQMCDEIEQGDKN